MRTLADYTANDVTPEDRSDYTKHVELWQAELHPHGALECCFAAEIVRAAWRIERYSPLGPQLEATASSDTARANWLRHREQTSFSIRRNLQELRRLQSDRYLQSHLGIQLPGVVSLKAVLPALRLPKGQATTENAATEPAQRTIQETEALLHAQIQAEARQLAEFRKSNPDPDPEPAPRAAVPLSPKPEAPRNAPCPCHSGRKYKQCCGHWSKTSLPKAA